MTAKLAKRRLQLPTWENIPDQVLTFGPEVTDLCTKAGFEPYPEQAYALDAIFAVGADGLAAAFENVIIAARQQLKTGLIVQAKIGWLYVLELPLITYSAHNGKAVTEAFRKTTQVITGSPVLSKRLRPGPSQGILSGKGDESIELRSSQRVLYLVRTGDNGRSLAANRMVLDEMYAVEEAHTGALYPALSSIDDPQVLGASSACKVDSDVLRDARDRGRAGTDDRQFFAEWGDPDAWSGCADDDCDHARNRDGCAADDVERWKRILPIHTPQRLEVVRKLRQSMPPAEFLREIMVWHDDPVKFGTTILPGWGDCEIDDEDEELDEPTEALVLGVGVAPDLSWSSIGAGSKWEDGRIHLAPVDRRRGTKWLSKALKDRQGRTNCAVVIDEKVADAMLIRRLEDDGVELHVMTLDERLEAHSWLKGAVADGDVTHFGYAELDDAVAGAATRSVGDGRTLLGRRASATDISMLEACESAGWGVSEGITAGAFSIF